MTTTEYAIWNVCRAMASAHNGIVFFSGPKIAQKFRSLSKNTPYIALKSLVESGWFKKVKDSTRREDWTYTPTHYRVLNHEQWAAEHPGCCCLPSQSRGIEPSQSEGKAPSQRKGTVRKPSRFEGSPSQLEGKPSHSQGTNLYKQPIQTTDADSLVLGPSQLEGMAFIERFKKRRRRQRGAAPAPLPKAQPFPQTGMGVPSTNAPAAPPAKPATPKADPIFEAAMAKLRQQVNGLA